jgi:tetratricopeptide (TPR) repeat protein
MTNRNCNAKFSDVLPRLTSYLVTFALLAFVLVLAAAGQDASAVPPSKLIEDGERQLEDGRTTLNQETLLAAKNAFETCVHRDSKNSPCCYDLARTEAYLAREREFAKDKKGVERWIDSAIADVQRSIALNNRSAEAHALLADLYGSKISGMMSGMMYGPKANAETQRAFDLDPNNAQAFAVVGRKYFFAPSMFGGDLNKAIESFKKATTLNPHYDEAFVWLAIAYRKKGDSQDAQAALTEALRLNSRSVFAKRIQSGASL